jgi:hypothetical protein
MILKVRTRDGWVVIPGIERAEYGGPESKRMGFYTNGEGEQKVYVKVAKSRLEDEELYYPQYDVLIIGAGYYKEAENVEVHGRSILETVYHEENADEVHFEPVVFMAWLQDSETKRTFMFDEAFLMNDDGKTIERIA